MFQNNNEFRKSLVLYGFTESKLILHFKFVIGGVSIQIKFVQLTIDIVALDLVDSLDLVDKSVLTNFY